MKAKPCPFCGSDAEVSADASQPTLEKALTSDPMAKCSQCGCGARFIIMNLSEWNKRTDSTEKEENNARL